MLKLCIIGSSEIVDHHLMVAKKLGFSLYAISSTRKNSLNAKKKFKKFEIKKYFSNYRDLIKETSKLKNVCYLVAPRIKDTLKILYDLDSVNSPILVEKPISTSVRAFSAKINKKKNIFVGYNRIFYETTRYLKLIKISNSLVNITCPEKNEYTFVTNSCHIISILVYLFKELRLIKKIKSKYFINVIFKSEKNNYINLCVFYNLKTNFKIEINNTNYFISQTPIEQIKIYKKLEILRKKHRNFYIPKLYKKINCNENFKPGFINQMKEFKEFAKNKNFKIDNNILFAKKVIKICNQILR